MQPADGRTSDPERNLAEICATVAGASPVPTAAVTGPLHNIEFVNTAFCLLTQTARENLVGRPFAEFVAEGHECLGLLSRVSRTAQPETSTGQEGAAPSSMWSYMMWPILTSDVRLVGVLIQVTESAPAHERLAAVNQALLISALKQHELTENAEALNTQLEADAVLLKDSADALQRANYDLERFTFVASHDLQEPLRTVTAYTQLLARQIDSRLQPKDRVLMQFIVDGSLRMSALINDLLAFGRVGADEGQVRHRVDCSLALQEALDNLKGSIDAAHGVITADALPIVNANFPQIVRLFQNLVGNALKYRRPDVSPQIHITSVHSDAKWTVSVADNGIGFNQKYEESIFGVFKRLHGSKYPGTGIGLAICQRIVALHGGRIWGTGIEGVGATLFFTLPDSVPIEN